MALVVPRTARVSSAQNYSLDTDSTMALVSLFRSPLSSRACFDPRTRRQFLQHHRPCPAALAAKPSRRQASTRIKAAAEEKESVEAGPSTVNEIAAPPGFVPAEPRTYAIPEGELWNVLSAGIPPMVLRLAAGMIATTYQMNLEDAASVPAWQYKLGPFFGKYMVESSSFPRRPEKPIIIYEFEACPFCRKVREAVSALDLDVLYYPTPQGGPTFRPKAISLGGKKQFPYMVDPNTGTSMYESDDIIKYLADTYGDGTVPLMLRLGLLTTITAGLAQLLRIGKGARYSAAKQPSQPLEIWALEPSPFCKLVREVLVELELPHIYHSTPRGSKKRSELIKRTGRFQVPYLEDPNTGVTTFESKAIIQYLKETYALPAAT